MRRNRNDNQKESFSINLIDDLSDYISTGIVRVSGGVMKAKRLWWTLRTTFLRGGVRRADYARKKRIYAHVGINVSIQSRIIPIYPELISFHNNILVARNVDFVTHDVIAYVLNRLPVSEVPADKGERYNFHEHIGCIEIMDNVMIGSNSVILYGSRIGPNVIVASGSVVSKDCEPNSVYAGCPARKIGSFDDFINRRHNNEKKRIIATTVHNQALTREEIENAWAVFANKHAQNCYKPSK